MTDEEMAEKYAKGLCKTCKVDVCRYSKIQTCVTKESLKQAYLAGLKAGRETEREYVKNNAFTSMKEQGLFPFGKWHKVADGDYPPYENAIVVSMFLQTLGILLIIIMMMNVG